MTLSNHPDAVSVFLAIAPLLTCTLFLLILKKTVLQSAFIGLISAILITLVFPAYHLTVSQLSNAVLSAILLSLNAALVIIPGLYFNAVLKQQGVLPKIISKLEGINIPTPYKVLILLLGILPAVESLTGFGVCLLLGVPIYCSMISSDKAAKLSMLSMNIMPWATLTIATLVGASLTHQSPSLLSSNTAIISLGVFTTVGMLALHVMGGYRAIFDYFWFVIILGLCLPIFLYVLSKLGLGEAVGIVSGAITALFGGVIVYFFVLKKNKMIVSQWNTSSEKLDFKTLMPYLLLLVFVLATRLYQPIYTAMQSIWVIHSSRVKLSVLASPGIIILAVTLIMLFLKSVEIKHNAVLGRAKNMLLGLVCFMLLSQLMLENSMVSVLTRTVLRLLDDFLYVVSPALGMFSGFLAGSGLGGNAMMMVMQQQIGLSLHAEHLFTAIQNSSAGHAAFTSLPFILLVKTIMQDYTNNKIHEGQMLAFGLKAAFFILITFVITIFSVRYISLIV